MSTNLTTIANAAAQFLGVIDSGEGLSTQQVLDILAATNNWLDNLSSEGLFAVADLVTTFPTVAATQTYTIGAGQTINLARPVRIVAAAARLTSGPGNPVEVVNEKAWAAIEDRQAQSWMVRKLFYDRGTPTGTIYLSPVPIGILTMEIHTWVALTQFADATTAITIPPGYLRFIELGVVQEVAAQFDMAVPASTLQNFADAAARVRALNASLIGDLPPEAAQGAA